MNGLLGNVRGTIVSAVSDRKLLSLEKCLLSVQDWQTKIKDMESQYSSALPKNPAAANFSERKTDALTSIENFLQEIFDIMKSDRENVDQNLEIYNGKVQASLTGMQDALAELSANGEALVKLRAEAKRVLQEKCSKLKESIERVFEKCENMGMDIKTFQVTKNDCVKRVNLLKKADSSNAWNISLLKAHVSSCEDEEKHLQALLDETKNALEAEIKKWQDQVQAIRTEFTLTSAEIKTFIKNINAGDYLKDPGVIMHEKNEDKRLIMISMQGKVLHENIQKAEKHITEGNKSWDEWRDHEDRFKKQYLEKILTKLTGSNESLVALNLCFKKVWRRLTTKAPLTMPKLDDVAYRCTMRYWRYLA
jgi:chromosome segregation ATPase